MNKDIEKFIDLMFDSNIEEEIKKESKILEIVKERNDLKQKINKIREFINQNKENTTQSLDFENNKTYNTALIELLEILGDKE